METIAAVASIVQAIGGWPIALTLVVVLALPAFLHVWVLNKIANAMLALREEVKADLKTQAGFYDDNVELVERCLNNEDKMFQVIQLNVASNEKLGSLIEQTLKALGEKRS